MSSDDDILTFEEDMHEVQESEDDDLSWRLLVVDDDPEVHSVTRLALKGFTFGGKALAIDSAHSGHEAKQKFREHSYAIALLDVVMETDHAGLDLVHWIREELADPYVRLVLRTGQPGQAPEREVISSYDINDYKEKTELTANKLYTLICASLRSYRDMIALYQNKVGLEKVIDSTSKIFAHQSLNEFTQGALQQISALLHLNTGAMYTELNCFAAEHTQSTNKILAATGRFADKVEKTLEDALSQNELAEVKSVLHEGGQHFGERFFVGVYNSMVDRKHLLFLEGFEGLSEIDRQLVQIFGQNIGIAFDNQYMYSEVELTQREMVYRLSEAVESRSKETSNHVKRMALTCRMIGKSCGLSPKEIEILYKAAPLHDIGKIAIPDQILNKPGKLEADEWEIMKTHAQIGHDILAGSGLEVLKAGAIIAGGHHENWDGSGYPHGLAGKEIPIMARIAAIADVFDALVNKRCYKEAWPLDKTIRFLKEMRGVKFDPELVDIVIDKQATLMSIQLANAD